MPETEHHLPPLSLPGGAENLKMLYDTVMSHLSRIAADAEVDARAWRDLAQRRAHNAAAYDHAVSMGSVLAAQAGVTSQQQTVSPIRTGAADTQVQQPSGSVYPPIRNVDQSSATAQAGVQTAMQALADAVANLQNLLVAQVAAK